MATVLSRPVTRRVPSALRQGDLVVTLTEYGIAMRLPRTRTSYLLPYGIAFSRAALLAADQVRRERAERRKARRR